jgi:hypothetical protein
MEMQSAGERNAFDVPIMASTDYLEWLEINEGIETGSLTAPGVEPTVGRTDKQPAGEETAVDVPILASTDYVEWLEINEGIETGSLTAPGVEPTVFPGPSEPVEVPEGG